MLGEMKFKVALNLVNIKPNDLAMIRWLFANGL